MNKICFLNLVTRQKIPHDLEKNKEYAEQSSYVTKLGTLVTLLCFSMREEDHLNNHYFDPFSFLTQSHFEAA